jgi:non-canonical (house-cleaning) NTP pyrophosphatase
LIASQQQQQQQQQQQETSQKEYNPTIDFAIGLEGGLEKIIHPQTRDNQLYCMAWMAIVGKRDFASSRTNNTHNTHNTTTNLYWSYAKTASFLLPPKICQLVLEQNMELGHADDAVFDRVNSKHGSGTVGVLTKGEIDRRGYYVHALKLALIPWIVDELYLD